jgi:hypothetical protein
VRRMVTVVGPAGSDVAGSSMPSNRSFSSQEVTSEVSSPDVGACSGLVRPPASAAGEGDLDRGARYPGAYVVIVNDTVNYYVIESTNVVN